MLRSEASEIGANTELHVLDAPLAVLQERIAKRNLDLPADAFRIEAEDLDRWSKLFEVPTADELRQP